MEGTFINFALEGSSAALTLKRKTCRMTIQDSSAPWNQPPTCWIGHRWDGWVLSVSASSDNTSECVQKWWLECIYGHAHVPTKSRDMSGDRSWELESGPGPLLQRVQTNSHTCIFGVKDMGSVSLEESIWKDMWEVYILTRNVRFNFFCIEAHIFTLT